MRALRSVVGNEGGGGPAVTLVKRRRSAATSPTGAAGLQRCWASRLHRLQGGQPPRINRHCRLNLDSTLFAVALAGSRLLTVASSPLGQCS
jgi:hypothetical protein